MASHHDWIAEASAAHDRDKPFAPENGQPLKFKVGDEVTYTNAYGATFPLVITGLCEPIHGGYIFGERYYLNSSSPWVGHAETELTARVAKA